MALSRSFIYSSLNRFKHLLKPPICLIISTHFLSSNSQIRVSDYLINHYQFSPDIADKISSTLPYVKDSEKADAILSFLKEFGFSQSHIEKILKCYPRLLCAKLDKSIKPKIKIFKDLGFSPTDISEIISRDPCLMITSANNQLAPSILMLKRIVGSHVEVCSMLKKSTWVLHRDLEKTMLPNIELLKSCGISSANISKFLHQFPRFFTYKPETMKYFIQRVDDMGFDRKSKLLFYALRIMSSMTVENWEHKLKVFKSLGFSEDDLLSVFRRYPQAFGISERKITEVSKVLFTTGNIDISSIVKNPVLLTYSLETRLKPRIRVLEILDMKNLLWKKRTWTTVLQISEKQFLNEYVIPYSNELMRFHEAGEGLSNLPKTWLSTVGKHIVVG